MRGIERFRVFFCKKEQKIIKTSFQKHDFLIYCIVVLQGEESGI